MSVANLNIVIGANVSQAVTGLSTVSTQLTKTSAAANTVSTSFVGASTSANKAGTSFNTLSTTMQKPIASSGLLSGIFSRLAGSLIGVGGVTVAIKLVSDTIAFYSRNAEEAKKRTEEFNDAIAKSSASVNTELVKLSALIQVVRDTGESYKVRNNALNEAQKLYPGYLANINLENINSQEAAHAIDKLTESLIRKAQVQAYSNLLTKASEDLIKKQTSGVKDNLNAFEKLAYSIGNKGIIGFTAVSTAARNQAADIKILQGVVDNYSHKLSDLTQEQAENLDFYIKAPTATKATAKGIKNVADEVEKATAAIRGFVAESAKLASVSLTPLPSLLNQPETQDLTKLVEKDKLKQVSEEMDKIARVTQLVGSAFETVFSSIENGTNVFDSIGQALKQLITKLVATVVEAAVLSLILNALFPGSGQALSGAFSFAKQFQGLLHFGTGGVVTKPTLALIGESGPEKITPLGYEGRGSNGFPDQVKFRAEGRDLVAVLERQQRLNGAID